MPAGIVLTAAELGALRGLPHSAHALYLALRSRMDYRTGIVGSPVGISWQALREDLYIEPHSGPVPASPGREAVRRICAWLERAGLVQMRSNAAQAQLLFRLPLARTLSLARNQPDRNPTREPDRGRTEGQSTGTRQGRGGPTRQTSGNGDTHQPAAAARAYLEIPLTELVFPPGTSTPQQRAFGAIGTKHRMTRDELQLALDELHGIGKKSAVRNGAALLDTLCQQIKAGTFYGTQAEQLRQGGSGLSAEEARFINEGGRA